MLWGFIIDIYHITLLIIHWALFAFYLSLYYYYYSKMFVSFYIQHYIYIYIYIYIAILGVRTVGKLGELRITNEFNSDWLPHTAMCQTKLNLVNDNMHYIHISTTVLKCNEFYNKKWSNLTPSFHSFLQSIPLLVVCTLMVVKIPQTFLQHLINLRKNVTPYKSMKKMESIRVPKRVLYEELSVGSWNNSHPKLQ